MIVSSVDRAALENLDPRLMQELIREFRLLFGMSNKGFV